MRKRTIKRTRNGSRGCPWLAGPESALSRPSLSRPSLRRRTLARNYSESGVELDGDDRAKLDMLESYMAGVGGEAAEGGEAGEESPARSMLKTRPRSQQTMRPPTAAEAHPLAQGMPHAFA